MAEAEEEMICDFAETYHIYDYQALQPEMAAVLVCGLRGNSRVKTKLYGTERIKDEIYLLAAIADRLSYLVWFQTEDGQKGRNRPQSFIELLMGETPDEELVAFDTKEELDEALESFRRRENGN